MNTRSTVLRAIPCACLLLCSTPALAQQVINGTTESVPGTRPNPWTTGTLTVGSTGTGRLNVNAGGVVNSSTSTLGSTATGNGTVTVGGQDARWTNSTLTVGSLGTGTLTIQNGGRVETQGASATVGGTTTGSGSVLISGAGSGGTKSTWAITNAFGISSGSVRVENGGLLTAVTANLDKGSLLVTGSGSTLKLDNNIFIRNSASFTVTDSAVATTFRGWIGDQPSTETALAIVRNGATWSLDESLSPRPDTHSILAVGRRANGELRIESGGGVSGLRTTIGGELASAVPNLTGNATVTGPGSGLAMTQDISVGELGKGTLSVLQGGRVTSGSSAIGSTATGTGFVTVSGANSQWAITGTLQNGVAGTGTLTVSDGGKVTATQAITNDGTIGVQDSASLLSTQNVLTVGATKAAQLTASGGASVSSQQGKVGSGAAGVVTLGSGARWDVTQNLWVGESARGTLTVTGGAQLTSGGVNDQIGRNAGGAGSIVTLTGRDPVSGTPSKWTRGSQTLYLGLGGGGNTLEVRDGAQLDSAGSQIALNFQAPGTGNTLQVSGQGSLVTTTDLTVGYLGRDNLLRIEDGGRVQATSGQVGGLESTYDRAIVTGADGAATPSTWDIAGQIFVGNNRSAGNGLDILAGGRVTARSAIIGAGSLASANALTVDGKGSALIVGRQPSALARTFTLGNSGSGNSLTISGGGRVEAYQNVTLGRQLGANGNQLTITGAGSSLYAEGGFAVGRNGASNSASISDGARLETHDGAWIGSDSGSPATGNHVDVSGAASSWSLVGDLNIGSALAPLGDGVEDTPAHTPSSAAAGNYLLIANGARATQSGGDTTIGAGGNQLNVQASSTFTSDGNIAVGSGSRLSLGPGARVSGGSLNMAAGSQLDVFAQENNSSLVTLGGKADLGGTLNALIDGRSSLSHRFLVLKAGMVNGTFDAAVLDDYSANLDWTVLYTPTDVFLQLEAQVADIAGLNENQQNVADSLDSFFNGGGDLPSSFLPILDLTGDDLGQALSQLSGEAGASGGAAAAVSANASFLRSMLYHPCTDEQLPNPERRCEHSVWATGFGSTASLPGNAAKGSHDTTTSTAGIATGWDRSDGDLSVGVAIAGGGTGWNLTGSGMGSGDATFLQLGAHGTKQLGHAYAALAGAYALQAMSTERRVTALEDETLKADVVANAVAGRGEAGYRFGAADGLGLTPYAALQAQAIRTPSYDETGTLGAASYALSYDAATTTAVRSELGLGVDLATGAARFAARAAWAHDWLNDANARAGFQSLPGTSFIVNGAEAPADLALVSLSAGVTLAPAADLAARFDGEFGADYQSYAGSLALTWSW